MLSDEVAQWTADARPELVGLGAAATGAYDRIDRVLAFFENTEVTTQLDSLLKSQLRSESSRRSDLPLVLSIVAVSAAESRWTPFTES